MFHPPRAPSRASLVLHAPTPTEEGELQVAEQHVESLWRDIVTELLQLSERPDSSVPQLTYQQRSYLQLVKPIMLVDGYAVLSAPHAAAKTVVEESLAPHITSLLSLIHI